MTYDTPDVEFYRCRRSNPSHSYALPAEFYVSEYRFTFNCKLQKPASSLSLSNFSTLIINPQTKFKWDGPSNLLFPSLCINLFTLIIWYMNYKCFNSWYKIQQRYWYYLLTKKYLNQNLLSMHYLPAKLSIFGN